MSSTTHATRGSSIAFSTSAGVPATSHAIPSSASASRIVSR
jgi:hypothetical protein